MHAARLFAGCSVTSAASHVGESRFAACPVATVDSSDDDADGWVPATDVEAVVVVVVVVVVSAAAAAAAADDDDDGHELLVVGVA